MAQLGSVVREKRKRKGWSQTVLGDLVGMSAATIHRIEHGERIPTDDELQLLANTLTLDTTQVITLANSDRAYLRDNVPDTSYQTQWEYAHPATYTGRVWIQIYPEVKATESQIEIQICWGAWQYQQSLDITNHKSISLWHYKFNDGQGLPMIVTLSQPCYLVFGKGTAPDKVVIDIISQWKRIQPMSPTQVLRFGVDFIRVYVGWHFKKVRNHRYE